MVPYTVEFEIANVSVVKDGNGKFGIISSGILVECFKYDSISCFENDSQYRYLRLEEDGKIGIFDAIKVDAVCYCTLSEITRVDFEKKIIQGKEIMIDNLKIGCLSKILSWTITIDLKENEKQ